MDLNEDDVIQIIRYLDESGFNELRLQMGDLRIVVNRSGSSAPLPEARPGRESARPAVSAAVRRGAAHGGRSQRRGVGISRG